MALYFIQRVIPGTEPDFGVYVLYKQRGTYSCSSGSRQTSLTRNTDIALAITPKCHLGTTNPPLPIRCRAGTYSWIPGYFNPKLPAPSITPHRPPWWALTSAALQHLCTELPTRPARNPLAAQLHASVGLPRGAHRRVAGSTAPIVLLKALSVWRSGMRAPALQPGLKHARRSSWEVSEMGIRTGMPGSPEGPASPISPGLPCGGESKRWVRASLRSHFSPTQSHKRRRELKPGSGNKNSFKLLQI